MMRQNVISGRGRWSTNLGAALESRLHPSVRVSRFELLKTKSMTSCAALESRLHPSVRVSRFRIQTKAALEEFKPCHGPVVDDATAAAFVTPKRSLLQ
jgi:hypothetical protein